MINVPLKWYLYEECDFNAVPQWVVVMGSNCKLLVASKMTGGHPLDPNEWDSVLGKLLKYHLNISEEIKEMITKIRQEMNQDLVPVAEDRANYGKVVKKVIRSMWALEYEIVDIQEAFAKQMGSIDIENLTDDFIEEMLLQSKPLQGVLHAIRDRQKVYISVLTYNTEWG